MAIETNVTYSGQKKTDVLSGQLRIEDGNNRMVLFDGTDNRMIIGVASYDIAGNGFQVEDIIVAGPPGDWTLIISLGNYSGSTVSGSIYYRAYEI